MIQVVTVCTANQCRSPFAARVLDRFLRERGIVAAVASTGVDVLEGARPPADWADVAREHGIDLTDHRATSPEGLLDAADLVLPMTADHLRAVAVGWPRVVGRAGTLGEVAHHGLRRRTAFEVLNAGREHDIADPVGRSRRRQRAVAAEIVAACRLLADRWPP